MGHPDIENSTPFAFELLQLADESGRAIVVPVVKATFDILPDGALELAESQRPVNLTGEHWGDPDTSAYKYEPETAFCKPSTDVVLIGHAHAPRAGATAALVKFQVGALHRTLRVTGDRAWIQSAAGVVPSAPAPFERIPLSYDRAYGGWDRSADDPSAHRCDPRNPSGVAYRRRGARFVEGAALPNIEDLAHPLASYTGTSVPAGVGFTSPHWHPRSELAGTYDNKWAEQRAPLLPKNFRRAYFNAASAGLIADGYLRGDEPVLAEGVAPGRALRTRLPALARPRCSMRCRTAGPATVDTQLDTVIVDCDQRQLVLLWRGLMVLSEGLQGVAAIQVSCENAPRRKQKDPAPQNVIPIAAAQKRSA